MASVNLIALNLCVESIQVRSCIRTLIMHSHFGHAFALWPADLVVTSQHEIQMKTVPDPREGSEQEKSQWVPCSPGLLHEVAMAPLARRRALLKLIAGGTGLAAIGGGTAIGLLASKSKKPGANPLGGIACLSVYDQMPKYLNGTLEELLAEQVTSHLMVCIKCRQMYKKMCSASESRPRKPTFRLPSSAVQ